VNTAPFGAKRPLWNMKCPALPIWQQHPAASRWDEWNMASPHSETRSRWCNGYVLFAALAGAQAIWILQGIDLVDAGFYLTSQAHSFPRPPRPGSIYIYQMTWFLSDYVGGMWLALSREPSLLWARVGGVLVQSLTAVVSYVLLSAHFSARKVFWVVLICSLFITSLCYSLSIHCYTFPALLVCLALLVFDRLLSADPFAPRGKLLACLLGFLLVSTALARLPLLTCAAVMLPIIGVTGTGARSGRMEWTARVLWVVAGMIVSAALYGLIYRWLGILNTYVISVYTLLAGSMQGDTAVTDHHRMSSLLASYLAGYANYAALGLLGSLVLLGLWRVRERAGRPAMNTGLAIVVLGGYAMLVHRHGTRIATSKIMCGLGVAVVFTLVLFLVLMRQQRKRDCAPFLAGVLIMILSPLGSGCGLTTMNYGMWVGLPFAFLAMDAMAKEVKSSRLGWMCSLGNLGLWLLVPVVLVAHYGNLYGDRANRLELNTQFRHRALRHIYSHATRVAQVDAALAKIDELTRRGEPVLIDAASGFFVGSPQGLW